MTKSEYNGWTNYETWLVNLWLNNDESIVEWMVEKVRELRDFYAEDDEDGPCVDNASVLRAMTIAVEDYMTEMVLQDMEDASLRFDILTAFLREVNWKEIADYMIDVEYEDHVDSAQ